MIGRARHPRRLTRFPFPLPTCRGGKAGTSGTRKNRNRYPFIPFLSRRTVRPRVYFLPKGAILALTMACLHPVVRIYVPASIGLLGFFLFGTRSVASVLMALPSTGRVRPKICNTPRIAPTNASNSSERLFALTWLTQRA